MHSVVIFLRSALFNALFFLNLILLLIISLPTFFMPQRGILTMAKVWGWTSNWLLRVIVGTKVEIRGLEKLPKGGYLVAAKHQSIWETFTLVTLFDLPTFILKRELMWIPVFGWLTLKAGMIPIDRGARSQTIPAMLRRAREAIRMARQMIIFPEGTRRAADAPPAYKYGAARIYQRAEAPCVPVAVNSGLFWPRRGFRKYPGTIVLEILDPIPPGLPPDEFFARMQEAIETATARLLADGMRERAALGIPVNGAAK
ncbi:MAG: 1-acyl-sn-glycerol-3-phosphate acyltransferase [Variibacter sp.]|jgi:1-acyl-sn-glycerol-3-phosphate acyltransferase|nr:1-acyl-sn-glycerol-3-phosphate acyltransferase [Variibacter sp.]